MSRTILITGASDGIGAAAARQLHDAGERVIIVGRDPVKTARVADALEAPRYVADFADLDQVRALAADVRTHHPRIDVLANNAGGVFGERTLTIDGHERTFQVNHLAPFLLTALLQDLLTENGASVIQTSSAAAQRFSRFDVDDLDGTRRFSRTTAYGNAKLANILFTVELQRRHGASASRPGVFAVAFHPGVIASGFAADSRGPWRWLYTNPLSRRLLTPVDVGGARLTWLALGVPGRDWTPGAYYERNRPAKPHPRAADAHLAATLWERSAEMVGLPGS